LTGYAVQVVNKNGARRVEVGPTTLLLDYDESLEVLTLSTGKPKTTDALKHDVYLRYENNLISDVINITTKDNVEMNLKVQYHVNFLTEYKDKWFSVENYVKFLCDHTRSIIKGTAKSYDIKEVNDNASSIFRDAILGEKKEDEARTLNFDENGMVITDVDILNLTIQDLKIAQLVKNAQQQTVETTIALASEEHNLNLVKRQLEIKSTIARLQSDLVLSTEDLRQTELKKQAETNLQRLQVEAKQKETQLSTELASAETKAEIANVNLGSVGKAKELELNKKERQIGFYKDRMEAIGPNLIEAMTQLGRTEMATKLAAVIAPLAIQEHTGLATTVERVFKDTPLEAFVSNLKGDNSTVKVSPGVLTPRLPLPK
jgi:major vault protein